MEPNDIVAHSRARFDYQTKKKLLREKYEAKMIFAYGGGLWQAGPALLCVLALCDHDAVIADLYHNPVLVNVPELIKLAQERWQEQMNAWLHEYNTLNTAS